AYHTDGLPIKATQCDQLFFSSSYITIQDDHNQQISPKSSSLNQRHKGSNEELFSSRTKTNGKFFSPNYPQFYKASMLCKYYFLAHYNERIVIKLNHVQLWSYKRSEYVCFQIDPRCNCVMNFLLVLLLTPRPASFNNNLFAFYWYCLLESSH
ncbi:unnamed protein product, partial [Schistosoma curassoni]|uniref:CUB domain-containing protein n=1 Tax=Schistosoma curassoni TaxID=6186 RepID=A0A183JR09_9TREM